MHLVPVILFYSVAAFFAMRVFLLEPGTLGHNWDSPVPAPLEHLLDVNRNSFIAWNKAYFGMPKGMELSTGALTFLYSLPARAGLSGEFASKMMYFSAIVIAAVSMYLFIKATIVDEKGAPGKNSVFPALMGGYLYGLSPFLFNDMIGGAITQFFAYAFLPLLLLFTHRLMNAGRSWPVYAFFFAVVLSLIAPSAHFTFLFSAIAAAYALLFSGLRVPLTRLGAAFFLFALLNSFWLLPFLSDLRGASATLPNAQNTGSILDSIRQAPDLTKVFTLAGYLNRHFALQTVAPGLKPVWFFCVFGLVAIIAYGLFVRDSQGPVRKKRLFWLCVLLTGLPLSAGTHSSLGGVVAWAFEHIPFMIIFRSPQRLMVLPSFALSALLGYGLWYILRDSRGYSKKAKAAAVFAMATVWVSPFYTGNLGMDYLKYQGWGNSIDNYRLSGDYQKALDIINSDDESFRVLYLPVAISPVYAKTEFQNTAQGGDPLVINSPRPAVASIVGGNRGAFSMIEELKKEIYVNGDIERALKILRPLNARYIFLRKDINLDIYDSFRDYWQVELVGRRLKDCKGLELLVDGPYAMLFRITDARLAHIYAKGPVPDIVYPALTPAELALSGLLFEDGPALVFTEGQEKKIFEKIAEDNAGVTLVNKDINDLLSDARSHSIELPEKRDMGYIFMSGISGEEKSFTVPGTSAYELTSYFRPAAPRDYALDEIPGERSGWDLRDGRGPAKDDDQVLTLFASNFNPPARWGYSTRDGMWHWATNDSRLLVINPFDAPVKADVSLWAASFGKKRRLTISLNGREMGRLDLGGAAQKVQQRVISEMQDISQLAIESGRASAAEFTEVALRKGLNEIIFSADPGPAENENNFQAGIAIKSGPLVKQEEGGKAVWKNRAGFQAELNSNGLVFRDDYSQKGYRFGWITKHIEKEIDIRKNRYFEMEYFLPCDSEIFMETVFRVDTGGDGKEDISFPMTFGSLPDGKSRVEVDLFGELVRAYPSILRAGLVGIDFIPHRKWELESSGCGVVEYGIKRIRLYSDAVKDGEVAVKKASAPQGGPALYIDGQRIALSAMLKDKEKGAVAASTRKPLDKGGHGVRLVGGAGLLRISPVKDAPDTPWTPQINFRKIDSTRYIVSVKGAKGPFTLILGESYNDGWRAYARAPGGGTEPSSALVSAVSDRGKRTELKDHFIVNIYCNGWLVPFDGREDFEVVIEYAPQRLVEAGGLLALGVFVWFGGFLWYNRRGKKRHEAHR